MMTTKSKASQASLEQALISHKKRRSKRTKAVVPVRLWMVGDKQSHLAHTLDVSNHGVMLGGFRGDVKIGDKIGIQYRQKQAQFQVAWISAREGSSEKQIGAVCLESGKQVWGTKFPEQTDGYEKRD